MRQQLEEEQLKQCTFAPRLAPKVRASAGACDDGSAGNARLPLHERLGELQRDKR